MQGMTRRSFLATSGAAVALAGFRAESAAGAQGANEKVVLTLMGAGGRGSMHAAGFSGLPNVEFKYICDADLAKAGKMAAQLGKSAGKAPAAIVDVRQALDDKDVHGIIVATPEHWHALATIWACQAGKDVYVEKTPSMTVWEGRKMIEAARKYQRIVQVGFQNRSAPYAFTAREYVKSGKLGKVAYVKVYNMLNGSPWRATADSTPPATLDWDRWLGPAAKVPYSAGRCRGWTDWYDYCGGSYSGDASHQLDLARMVLGDPEPPKSAYCAGGNFAFKSQRPTPELQSVTYEFADFVMTCESCNFPPYMRKSNGEERMGKKFPYWPQNNERIEIYGTKQMMYLGRHGIGWQVLQAEGKIVDQEKGYFPDKWHQPDFIDAIRTRRQPNGDIEQAHHSSNLVHLANLSFRAGNVRLGFDPKSERFDNEKANELSRLVYRQGYQVPEQV